MPRFKDYGEEELTSLMHYIRENFDQDTACKLEKKFNSALKNMDASKFSKGVARIKENKDVKENVLKIKDGEYKED